MKNVILIISLLFTTLLKGQDHTCYRLLALEDFIKEQYSDSQAFYKSFYTVSHYLAVARENGIEGKVEVMLINHSDTSFEIHITNRKEKVFTKSIYESVKEMRKEWLNKNVPFILNFCIDFVLLYRDGKDRTPLSPCNLDVTSYAVHERKDTNYVHNSNEVSYKPQMIGYPSFLHYKRSNKYPSIQSMEDLLEEAIHSCCHKKLQLKHLEPAPPHSQGIFVKEQDYLRIFIHSKGYISKVELFGKFTKDLDEGTLMETLKSVRFYPALAGFKPVHISMEYGIEK